MKKRIRIITGSVCTALIICFCMLFSACEDNVDPYADFISDSSYTINSITATVTVNDDSTVDFVEEYNVTFHSYHYGIYRDLPVNSGERYRNIQILDSPWSSVEHYESFVRISLGLSDFDDPIKGDAHYKIGYTLVMPDRDSPDALYLNLIGFGWTTNIQQVNVQLHLPSAMTGETSFFTRYGSDTSSNGVECLQVGENEYRITAQNLAPFEGITLSSALPAGTMKLYSQPFPWTEFIFLVAALAIAVLLVCYAKNGQEVTEITNYYPPKIDGKELTPADVGMLIDGSLSTSDITSMIFYWASKGYLSIENADSKNPTLVKEKEISAEQAGGTQFLKLFDKIFESGNSVDIDSLQYKLSGRMQAILIESSKKTGKMYDRKAGVVGIVSAVAALVLCAGIVAFNGFGAIGSFDSALTVIPLAIAAIAAYVGNTVIWQYSYKIKHAAACVVAVNVIAALLAFATAFVVYKDVMTYAQSAMLFVGTMAVAIAGGMSHKRNGRYLEIMGEITGFKNFLVLAEKEKLEMLLEENPQYYYDILPYANVLGVTDKWEHKFKDLELMPPQYIHGHYAGNYLFIYHGMYHSVGRGMHMAMSPKPSSSSHSGFSIGGRGGGFGGGFGGGGFGGGGGGAR